LLSLVNKASQHHPKRGQLETVGSFKPNQIANARANFAGQMGAHEAPLAMIDSSTMQNGKAGMLLTTRRIYSSSIKQPIELTDIRDVSVKNPDAGDAVLTFLFGVFHPVQFRLRVNDTVVYSGRKSSYWKLWHPEFWEVLISRLAQAVQDSPAEPY
jgi:hypothetical protein